ncbi:hypothetical protein HA466_0058150 [Hirschfeldia incana]|nr:hypothetical protein HA466_0058150 [Hirschfeldia incana]
MKLDVKDVVAEMEDLKNVVLSYEEYHRESSVAALNGIRVLFEAALKEVKLMMRHKGYPADEHPMPPKPTIETETEPAMIIPYINGLIDVFVADFDVMKIAANSTVYPLSNYAYFFRLQMDKLRSRTLKEMDDVVRENRRMLLAEVLRVQIWKVRSIDVDMVESFLRSLETNPNHQETVEKLKRLQRCCCQVINRGREFISTHSFVPQLESFPLGQVAHVSNPVEQASAKSLIRQLAADGGELVYLVRCCMDAFLCCDFSPLRMKDLNDISDFVATIELGGRGSRVPRH